MSPNTNFANLGSMYLGKLGIIFFNVKFNVCEFSKSEIWLDMPH